MQAVLASTLVSEPTDLLINTLRQMARLGESPLSHLSTEEDSNVEDFLDLQCMAMTSYGTLLALESASNARCVISNNNCKTV